MGVAMMAWSDTVHTYTSHTSDFLISTTLKISTVLLQNNGLLKNDPNSGLQKKRHG